MPQWRYEELQLAMYMGIDPSIIENMTCSDFYDAQEVMYADMYLKGLI